MNTENKQIPTTLEGEFLKQFYELKEELEIAQKLLQNQKQITAEYKQELLMLIRFITSLLRVELGPTVGTYHCNEDNNDYHFINAHDVSTVEFRDAKNREIYNAVKKYLPIQQ